VTPQAQIIAIAEACGWKPDDDGDGTGWKGSWIRQRLIGKKPTFRDGKVVSYLIEQIVPDYLNDLNAMHEAEKVLFPKHEAKWAMLMSEVCGHSWRIIYTATAAQRAEAFLITLNLWKQ
jgi:hypothetical protein